MVRQVLTKVGKPEAIDTALMQVKRVNQLCRMEKIDYSRNLIVYIDVCHNESGLISVINELRMTHPGKSIKVACAFSKLKDIQRLVEILL